MRRKKEAESADIFSKLQREAEEQKRQQASKGSSGIVEDFNNLSPEEIQRRRDAWKLEKEARKAAKVERKVDRRSQRQERKRLRKAQKEERRRIRRDQRQDRRNARRQRRNGGLSEQNISRVS